MATLIAETARVDPRAELADDVEVGPFCIVGPKVRVGRGTRLLQHACLFGETTLGEFNTIGPFVAIGGEPQDVSYHGAPTRVEIGDHNVVREGATVHRASEKEDGVTRIGSHNLLMVKCHVAHDCQLGDGITMGSASMLAGHVHVESFAHLSDCVAVHQYVTIGGLSFVGTKAKVTQDVPRYLLAVGNPADIRCINVAGLKRSGLDAVRIRALREAYRLLYLAKMGVDQAAGILESHGDLTPEVRVLLDFIRAQRAGVGGRARGCRGA